MKDEFNKQERLPRQRYLDSYEALKLAVGKSRGMKKAALGEYLIQHLLEATQLETRIRVRLGAHVRDIRVVWRDDGVVLQGRSSTYYAKQLAQHLVMEATNIRIIANEIEVY